MPGEVNVASTAPTPTSAEQSASTSAPVSAPAPASTPARSHPAPASLRGSILWWLTLGVVVLDQVTKIAIRQAISPFESRPVIQGLLDLVHVRNEGVAFGLLNGANLPYKSAYTTALVLLALGGVTWFARHLRPEERIARVGLSMILGGALGNLIDRVVHGYVLDFVDAYWRGWHFWAFNVADACISIGAVLVFAELLLVKPHASHSV